MLRFEPSCPYMLCAQLQGESCWQGHGTFPLPKSGAKPGQGKGEMANVCTQGCKSTSSKRKRKICAASFSPVDKHRDQTGMPGHDKFCSTCIFFNPSVAPGAIGCFAVMDYM